MQEGFRIISMNGLICPLTSTLENQDLFMFSNIRYADLKRNMRIFDTLPINEPDCIQRTHSQMHNLQPLQQLSPKQEKIRLIQNENILERQKQLNARSFELSEQNFSNITKDQKKIVRSKIPSNPKILQLKKINQKKKQIAEKLPKSQFEPNFTLRRVLSVDHLSSRDMLVQSPSLKPITIQKPRKKTKKKLIISPPPELKTLRYMYPVTPFNYQSEKHIQNYMEDRQVGTKKASRQKKKSILEPKYDKQTQCLTQDLHRTKV